MINKFIYSSMITIRLVLILNFENIMLKYVDLCIQGVQESDFFVWSFAVDQKS